MNSRSRPPRKALAGYAVALLAVAIALAARQWLDPLLDDRFPYTTVYLAIAVGAWYGGFRPALAATLVAAPLVSYFFVPPHGEFLPSDAQDRFGLGLFIVVALSIAGSTAALRRGRFRAEMREQVWQVTLRSIGDAVITTDAMSRVTFLNPAAVALTGWSQNDARDQPLASVFHIVNERTREPAGNPVEKVLADGRVVGLANHTILIARDGSEKTIDDSAAPIRDEAGNITGVVLVFRDVSERRQAERRMQESESRKAALVHAALDCIIHIDQTGRILEFNPAAEQCFGYRREDVMGLDMADLIIPPSLRQRHREGMAHYLTTGEGPIMDRRIEMTAVRADGTEFPVELSVTRILVDGPPIFAAFLRDITARQETLDKLHQAVGALAEADRRKDEFLALLAHELRNPLAPMRNAVQVLRLGGDADAVLAASDMMERQLGQMVRLVDDLLDVSRVSRGKIHLRRSRLELVSTVNHALEAARAFPQCREREIVVAIPMEPVYVDADATRLAQVVGNLLNNACKFTNNGGRIWLTVACEGDRAVIRVRDNGIGIAPDQLARIFGMFTQVDTSLDRSVGGLGIGLTLVREIVEMHGGTVEARSAGLGQGTEFIVSLPLTSAGEEPQAAAHTGAGPRRTIAHRILIVDDNRDSADSLAMLLKLKGNETRTAYSGDHAMEAAAEFHPRVILLDIGLPGEDGYEVARRMRVQPWGTDVLFVAMTGWGQDEDRFRSAKEGFIGHMVKPVDLHTLDQLLDEGRPRGA